MEEGESDDLWVYNVLCLSLVGFGQKLLVLESS